MRRRVELRPELVGRQLVGRGLEAVRPVCVGIARLGIQRRGEGRWTEALPNRCPWRERVCQIDVPGLGERLVERAPECARLGGGTRGWENYGQREQGDERAGRPGHGQSFPRLGTVAKSPPRPYDVG